MTPTEKQVTNLSLSQRLKELRVKQDSLFVWAFQTGTQDTPSLFLKDELSKIPLQFETTSAFLVGELGELLIWDLSIGNEIYTLSSGIRLSNHNVFDWYAGYRIPGTGYQIYGVNGDTEAETRAKLLIFLLEKRIIKASDL